MRKKRTLLLIFIILLCAIALFALGKRNRENVSASNTAEPNQEPKPFAIDDEYRTTYEIFVYSFCDSDGDGIGDLNGVRSKLDYISNLGFNAIWLTPVHPSSTYHKYDVDDYYEIDPAFGSHEDFEALINECHKKGIHVYMDLVLNHTSDEHEWFKEASEYLHHHPSGWEPDISYCKYFDYYNFTRQPAEGYTHLDGTEWYYESRFWSEMPDLNLDSEFVREEIKNIMEYWISKGIDGFRLDAVTSYYNGYPQGNTDFLRFVVETGKSIKPDCYFVGEAWTDRGSITALSHSGIDSLFNFPFSGPNGIIASVVKGSRPATDYLNEMIWAEQEQLSANPNFVDAPFYTNHDIDRSADYYPGDDGPQKKMAYAMSLFMRGNSFVYYGEELGMSGSGADENKRQAMPWDEAEKQATDIKSLLNWFKQVISIRNSFPSIARGVTEREDSLCDDGVAAFYRRSDAYDDVLIIMNLRNQTVSWDLSTLDANLKPGSGLITGKESITVVNGTLTMPGYSIEIFRIPNK